MRSRTKKALVTLGGAAAVALTVGFGGLGTTPMGQGSTVTTHPSSSVAQHPQQAATAAANGVHVATLTGCIAGANC